MFVKSFDNPEFVVTDQLYPVSYDYKTCQKLKLIIMKTLKKMMLALAILLTASAAYSATASTHAPSKDDVINTYLNAVVHGKLAGIENIIDDDAEFNLIRGNNVNRLNKGQILAALQSSENIDNDCQCTKTVVQDSDEISTVKVEMKHADFTRVDMITAQHAGNGWKITKVDTSFK
jgi:hypothetical protein